LFWPFALVAVLQALAVLGGLALFVIPGIYLSVLFSYSILMLIEEDRRGLNALASSADLIKGHWWGVFGRSLVSGVMVGLLISVSTLILLIVVGLFIGMDKIFNFATYATADTSVANPLADGIQALINGIVSSIFIPLAIIYQVKIFHSLKKSRNS
jgi:hypothetical protein